MKQTNGFSELQRSKNSFVLNGYFKCQMNENFNLRKIRNGYFRYLRFKYSRIMTAFEEKKFVCEPKQRKPLFTLKLAPVLAQIRFFPILINGFDRCRHKQLCTLSIPTFFNPHLTRTKLHCICDSHYVET